MSPRRKVLFRTAAVLLGLSVFLLCELICRLGGWGEQATATDAFTEFVGLRPLFQLSPDRQRYDVAANRRLYFAEESFPAQKAPGHRRVFVFGGSTVQGRPFSIPTAFSTFLKIGLRHADPTVSWEVVNCGGVSYASYRLLPIMRECLQYEPDLYIVCTGHNEFLECITYAEVRNSSELLKQTHGLLCQLRTVQILRETLRSLSPESGASTSAPLPARPLLPEEVDVLLDHQGGLEAYTREALQSTQIVRQFRINLTQMAELTEQAGVPLLFISPPSSLGDCPPFKSEFSADTTPEASAHILALLDNATAVSADRADKVVGRLKEAVHTDPSFAFAWYELGHALLNANRSDEALAAFIRAKDEDICPLRMTSALQQVMADVARTHDIPLLDAHQLMAGLSRNGIVGDGMLVDHIHPSFRGHQQIALAIIQQFRELELLPPDTAEWEPAAQSAFEEHVLSLDDLYFLRGQRTLQTLQAWAQGRGDGPPLVRTSDEGSPAADKNN
ncbi:MAG: hypothetical protein RIK87_03270 [Fuerstiella sp.]